MYSNPYDTNGANNYNAGVASNYNPNAASGGGGSATRTGLRDPRLVIEAFDSQGNSQNRGSPTGRNAAGNLNSQNRGSPTGGSGNAAGNVNPTDGVRKLRK
jgi:hypothetical protein